MKKIGRSMLATLAVSFMICTVGSVSMAYAGVSADEWKLLQSSTLQDRVGQIALSFSNLFRGRSSQNASLRSETDANELRNAAYRSIIQAAEESYGTLSNDGNGTTSILCKGFVWHGCLILIRMGRRSC